MSDIINEPARWQVIDKSSRPAKVVATGLSLQRAAEMAKTDDLFKIKAVFSASCPSFKTQR